MRILLIEDDPGDAELVVISLSSLHGPQRLDRASSLAQARTIRSDMAEFDIILLDLSLPDSTGFSTVTAARAIFPTSPIIVLTGLDDPDVEEKVVESGAQDYLVKGDFDDNDLARAIRHAIVRHRLEQRLVTSEAEQRALINLAPDAILVIAADHTVLSANPAAAKIFGIDDGDGIVGWHISRILPGASAMFEADRGAQEVRGDSVGLRDGVLFPVSLSMARLDAQRVMVMATDITERVRLTQELQELARTDPLTGLANRRAFIDAADSEFHRGKRSNTLSAILMIDIDHFKQINDRYGHEVGDSGLIRLAMTLKTMIRASDFPARFGGEEFVLLLTDVDKSGAVDMAERIRLAISECVIQSQDRSFHMTVSIGVSLFSKQDSNWSDALRRADQGMYQAKNLGRNMVVYGDFAGS